MNCEALEYGQTQVDDRGGIRAERKPVYEDTIKYERTLVRSASQRHNQILIARWI